MKTFAIILAAGRGSRMKGLTGDRPKCLLKLGGETLLRWQEKALNSAGIDHIHIVRGYLGECLPDRFTYSENERWNNTNMLYSLECASAHIDEMFTLGFEQFVISYSDIVYAGEHVKRLANSPADIALAYDTLWQSLWGLRFQNILDDAETFRQENGRLVEIGGKTERISDICGQYMGLLKLTRSGWEQWRNSAHQPGFNLESSDMTSFLRKLLRENLAIRCAGIGLLVRGG